ncbi:MAG: hypothetical protein LBQ12_13945 [Deltaproteobacteria bacterium]|nr:hypothetical protein [Deltaproteobacteria bacterium]
MERGSFRLLGLVRMGAVPSFDRGRDRSATTIRRPKGRREEGSGWRISRSRCGKVLSGKARIRPKLATGRETKLSIWESGASEAKPQGPSHPREKRNYSKPRGIASFFLALGISAEKDASARRGTGEKPGKSGKSGKIRKIRENPGKSGKIRENPGESGKIRENPGESGKIRENPGKSGRIRENPEGRQAGNGGNATSRPDAARRGHRN